MGDPSSAPSRSFLPLPVAPGSRRRAPRLAAALLLAVLVGGTLAPAEAVLPAGADAASESLLRRPGAALRAARDLATEGKVGKAEALLSRVAERHPLIADYAEWLRLRILVEDKRWREAADLGVWRHSESPLEADFARLLGDAHAELGDEVGARGLWDTARRATSNEDEAAALLVAIANSHERTGDEAAAASAYLDVWARYPLAPVAGEATERLAALERRLGRPLRNAAQERRRGDTFFRSNRNEEALAAYDRALASHSLSPGERGPALRQRAETLFRMRRYPEAAEAFAAAPQDDETRIARARCFARSGDVAGAARELETIGQQSRGEQGARARLLAGLLLDGEGETERASELFDAVVRTGGASNWADEALWQLGWNAYREGRFTEAMGHFARLEARTRDPLVALRPRYWRARAAQRAGRAGHDAELAAIARGYPLSYYGWRAGMLVEGDEGTLERGVVPAGTVALSSAALARPEILLEADLREQALAELNLLFPRARGLTDRLALAELYGDAGEEHRAQRLMMDAYEGALARLPTEGAPEVWWHAWPLPWPDDVQELAAKGGGVEPALVYAVMREESGYRPSALSVAGARGLLQLMPETATRVAREAGLPEPSPESLFQPRVNLDLGSRYLAQLLARFGGRASAAIASYNAGPHAVARWLENSALADDEWVESIPYEQTRAYTKRVLRSLHAYRVLY
ncbi:MAG TPA: lytic transglycosylase domain-containing protein [Myxococcota bacterium]|jgi:soluble lytic murein transglycosylase